MQEERVRELGQLVYTFLRATLEPAVRPSVSNLINLRTVIGSTVPVQPTRDCKFVHTALLILSALTID